jgi:uncharacterized protein YbjT (DUF2867 family)
MNLTVIGGTGLIGSQVVQKLTAAGHRAVPAAPSTGVDLITGQGLDQALEGAEVVINVANSPTFDEASADFFRTSMTNLLAQESARASGTDWLQAARLLVVGRLAAVNSVRMVHWPHAQGLGWRWSSRHS